MISINRSLIKPINRMNKLLIFFIVVIIGCKVQSDHSLKYCIYSNNELVFEISPRDIAFYDTSNKRDFHYIHEIRLKEGFYKKDTYKLAYPIDIFCFINGDKYFWGNHYYRGQPESGLQINFHFDPSCDNTWAFREGGTGAPIKGDTIVLFTKNECNSIELIHKRDEIEQNKKYYETLNYYNAYIDTARLAHEILSDPFYLNAIQNSGIEIK
jgi:hypothetical protein